MLTDDFYTISEVSEYLKIPDFVVYKLINLGELDILKFDYEYSSICGESLRFFIEKSRAFSKEFIKISEASKYLKVSEYKLKDLVKNGYLPSVDKNLTKSRDLLELKKTMDFSSYSVKRSYLDVENIVNHQNSRCRYFNIPGELTVNDIKNIFNEQKNRCFYCNGMLMQRNWVIDHYIPLCKDGTNHPENIKIACEACNSFKNGLDPEVFLSKFENVDYFCDLTTENDIALSIS